MTDIEELVKRLRGPRTEQGGLWPMPNLHEEAADALEAQAKEIAELKKCEKHLEEMLHGWREEALRASACIAELEAAIEPFRRVKGITSVYEYVPIEALRNDEEFNFRMNGAEMKKIYAALNVKS